MEFEKGVSLVSFLLKIKYLLDVNNEFIVKEFERLKNLFLKWCQQISSLKGYLKYRHQEQLLSIEK